MTTYFDTMDSPVGALLFVSEGEGISGIYMEEHRRGPRGAHDWRPNPEIFTAAKQQLAEYFRGERTEFDIELAPRGTEFQQRVWAALRTVPFGETVTYAELAQMAGVPGSARAAGGANARNPVSIVVPCHRVVGSNGTLTGYAGGIERKRDLLAHEAAVKANRVDSRAC